ncbi:MAG: radical SAM protein [Oscillospiraceae bacterium]
MSACFDCPRRCGVDRENGELGLCASPALPVAARAAAHFGEEPCISGTRGSGAVFFTGCSLGCVYCQNAVISRGGVGKELTVPELRDVFLRLRDTGVHNINLVTGTHFVRPIAEALTGLSLGIPVCWNSSGYESVESLKRLEGLVQIYMPDFKYSGSAPALKYSDAADYPEVAMAAIEEMFRQVGVYRMDENELLLSGVLIRHLILPGLIDNSMGVLDWVAKRFPLGGVLFSLMSQYTPMPSVGERFPELSRPVTQPVADMMYEHLLEVGIEDGYYQDTESGGEEMIPAFDCTGL